jgi:hypothetical protein
MLMILTMYFYRWFHQFVANQGVTVLAHVLQWYSRKDRRQIDMDIEYEVAKSLKVIFNTGVRSPSIGRGVLG